MMMDSLDCFCKAYNPSTLSRKKLTKKDYKQCILDFRILFKLDNDDSQLYESFYNQEDDGDEVTCQSKLNFLSEDFCGFPWDVDPFASHRSTFHCAKSDQHSCDQNTFSIDLDCKWSNNGCSAQPSNEIDSEGICMYFKNDKECNDYNFTISGSCTWHQKYIDEDLFHTEYAGFMNLIDKNCCIGNYSIPLELNQQYKIHTIQPSLSPSREFSYTTTPSTKMTKDTIELITTISGGAEEVNNGLPSTILVAGSVTFLITLVTYFWRTRKRMLLQRNKYKNEELTDPSKFKHVTTQIFKNPEKIDDKDQSIFEHIESLEQFEEIDPSMFEHIESLEQFEEIDPFQL